MKGKSLKAVDFFCGAGGMSSGFSQTGIKILAGIDIENQFKDTYLENHKKSKFINKDIIKYSPEDLRNEIKLSKFDDNLIFIGCSPCQYWSRVNTYRHGSFYSHNLLADFQRFVKYFMPGFVVVENVPGLLNNINNNVLLDFLDFLTFHGYKTVYKVVRTDQFGVPQKRKRFVLIASRVNTEIIFPLTEKSDNLTVRNFISPERGFPVIPCGHRDNDELKLHWTANLTERNISRLKKTPHDGGDRSSWSEDENLQIEAYKGKNNIFRSIYGRMEWDKPAPTITTRFLAISCGRFAHPEQNRGLSLREGATLQTFPKNYVFKGPMTSIAKQIGNAVPPEMAKRIALSIIEMKNKNLKNAV
jgi:DNA (cytosine-5)-methyltransferase 1